MQEKKGSEKREVLLISFSISARFVFAIIIVWKDSAMAKLVEMKNLGITVTSLSEISARISAVSDNDYKEYCANILKFQPVLLKGENVCL